MEKLLAVCAPGLEALLGRELQVLGLLGAKSAWPAWTKQGSGGVEFQGALEDVCRANLRLRVADRVLVRLGEFRASSFEDLRRISARLPWKRFLSKGRPVAFRVDCRKSKLYHEGAVAERLAGAISDCLGRETRVAKLSEDGSGNLPQIIVVRVENDLCSVSLDSSGTPLRKRGWRLATAKAPLAETLASAMVLASGWDRTSPLLDPFCGSGTIAIEAALLARNAAPGLCRKFAFMDWPGFDQDLWESLKSDAAGEGTAAAPKIMASDRDAGAIESAQANAKRAGVADRIEFACKAVSAIDPPAGPGWVVTNPPYGVRLGSSKDLRNLYARLGQVLGAKCQGWHATVLCGSSSLIGAAGLGLEPVLSTMNGGLKVSLAACRV